jgi:alcohol dehydrogenase
MRAVRYQEFGGTLTLTEVPDPTPPPGGVVLEITATGLCRSDWHGWQGHDDDITSLPHTPGHELAGVIVDMDSNVTRFRRGDRVTVPFVCACGTCRTCESGNHQVCERQWQPGFHGPGSFAEFIALPFADVNLVRLPPAISDATAAALGCRTATAYRALRHIGQVAPGETLVVHGCGGVGLSAVMIGRALGARVIAVDPNPTSQLIAQQLGAAETFAPSDNLIDDITEATAGGAHVSLDAIGSASVARTSILGLRRRGRHIQAGLLPHGADLPMGRIIAWELAVLGTHGMPAHDYPELLQWMREGKLRPDLLVTRTIGLSEVTQALPDMGSADHPAGITLIDPRID